MDLTEYKKSATHSVLVSDALNAPLLSLVVKLNDKTEVPSTNELNVYVDKSLTETSEKKTYTFNLKGVLGSVDEFRIEPVREEGKVTMKAYVKKADAEEVLTYEPIILFEGVNYIYTNYTNASIELIYPKDDDAIKSFISAAEYTKDAEVTQEDVFFKDCFTKENGNINEEINKLTVKCIDGANDNFSIDCDGNLTVKSITTTDTSASTPSFDAIYPVGSIYLTVNEVNPSSLFGGSWERITDRFLLGAGNAYSNLATGGEVSVTLTSDNIPSHSHRVPSLSGYTSEAGSHNHTGRYSAYGVGTGGYFVLRRISNEDGYKGTDVVTEYAGNHTHNITTYESTTGSIGNGTSHNNMPPYLAVNIWKRIS